MIKMANKLYVTINGEKQEAKGEILEQILKDHADQEARQSETLLLEAEYEAKKQLRIDAITKLGAASGLSEAEINSILNI
jgi:hypothetical protein